MTYSLADEEAARERAAAAAMRSALGRATALLEQKGQKVGALRFANLDVKQIIGASSMDVYTLPEYNTFAKSERFQESFWSAKKVAPPTPPPSPQPEKITVNATVQCAFQIQ